jgi:hypothetical protein
MEEDLEYHQTPQLIEFSAVSAVSDHSSCFNISSTYANIRSGSNNGGTSLKAKLFYLVIYCYKYWDVIMVFIYIIIVGIVVGLLANSAKKRFPAWLFILTAFLGALVGAGLSFGDSALFLSYPVLNIWTVPVLFAILFPLITLFADHGNMKAASAGIVFILAAIAGIVFLDSSPTDHSGLFKEELQRAGVERVGHPIEGFNAFIYLEAFPGFEEADFDNVKTLEGIYRIEGGKFKYVRTAGNPVTSAEETISEEGYKTLLQNFSKRVGVEVEAEVDIATLLDQLREGDVYPNPFIYDDFSIWLPEGWYQYEFERSVLFVHDPDLVFPGATGGYALAPWIQVGMQEIGMDEMFKQNLWIEGSEALVSKDNVLIGNDERIRVVTNAAGASGQMLHYVFDANDGRVFTVSIYPYEAGSQDTDDFERAVQSFMINYVFDGTGN